MYIKIKIIKVMDRIRKETGDLKPLIDSIREHGLINPITVMDTAEGYVLIAGYRRLQAVKALGEHDIWATVLDAMDADKQLKMEIDENEVRKSFTVRERLAYAEKVKVIERAKSRQRMSEHARDGHEKKQACPNGDTPEAQEAPVKKQRTDDIVADRAGFSSRQQYERAAYVADHCPDMLDQIDSGEKTISGAYNEIKAAQAEAESKPTQKKAKVGLSSVGYFINSEGNRQYGHIASPMDPERGRSFAIGEIADRIEAYKRDLTSLTKFYEEFSNAEGDEEVSRMLDELIECIPKTFGDHYVGKHRDL